MMRDGAGATDSGVVMALAGALGPVAAMLPEQGLEEVPEVDMGGGSYWNDGRGMAQGFGAGGQGYAFGEASGFGGISLDGVGSSHGMGYARGSGWGYDNS